MAVVSILHRLSGVLWILVLPILLFALQLSLRDAQGFAEVKAWLHNPLFVAVLVLWLWFLLHHFFAGMRFLLLDIDIAVSRRAARLAAWSVHVASVLSTLIIIGLLW